MKHWILEQQDGRLMMTEWQKADLHDWCLKNPKVKFQLEPVVATRTNAQNRFYWLYLGIIARETDNDPETLHEYFKKKFLTPLAGQIRGKDGTHEIKMIPSTATLSKLAMGDYMTQIEGYTKVKIPNPEDAGYYKG